MLSSIRAPTRAISRARPQSLLASVQAHLGKASQPRRLSKPVEPAATSTSTASRKVAPSTVTSEGNSIPSLLLRMSDDVPDTPIPTQNGTPSTPSTPVAETERVRMTAPSIMARTRARLGQMRATPPAPSTRQHPPTTSDATHAATTSSLGDRDSTEGDVSTPNLSPTPKSNEAVEVGSPSAQFGGINNGIHPFLSENMDAHSREMAIDGGEKSDAEMAHRDVANPDRCSDMYTILRCGDDGNGECASSHLQLSIRCVFDHHGVCTKATEVLEAVVERVARVRRVTR